MAVTAIEMITDALRAANVIDQTQAPEAEMGVLGLRVLNQLLGQWDRDGIRLGWVTVADLDDALPLDLQDERAVKFNLAVELAGEYGLEVLPRVQQIAKDTYNSLSKAHALTLESSLELMPTPQADWSAGSIGSGGL